MEPGDPTERVLESFARARRSGLGQAFYGFLLDVSEEIRTKFQHTDLERQVSLFEHGVLMLIKYGQDDAVGQMAIERLGRLHAPDRLDIDPELYDVWLSCLVHAVRTLDPRCDDRLADAWVDAVRPGLLRMRALYFEGARTRG